MNHMDRQFALEVVLHDADGEIERAKTAVVRCVSNSGASIHTEFIEAEGRFDFTPEGDLKFLLPMTAPQFIDFGFEIAAWTAIACFRGPDEGSELEQELERAGVSVSAAVSDLLWRDDAEDNWQRASIPRGLAVDLYAKRLRDRRFKRGNRER